MKQSLKNAPEDTKKNPAEDVPPVADANALAEIEGDTLPEVASSGALQLGTVSGEVSQTDMIIPKINIVQSTGNLSVEFTPGNLLLNKETVLNPTVGDEAAKPLNVVVLSIEKSYEEWPDEFVQDGPIPMRFKTLKEVIDAGLYIEWRNDQKPPAREVATATVLIEKPAGVDALAFNRTIDGKEYALARWGMRGTAYTRAAKKIFSSSAIELAKEGLLSGLWEVTIQRVKAGGNFVFAPIFSLNNTKNSVEWITEATNVLT